jgi:hypothetical protein
VKVNFEAAFRDETRDGAWGFIARSDIEEFIGAAAGKLGQLRDALIKAEVEALVLWQLRENCVGFTAGHFLV